MKEKKRKEAKEKKRKSSQKEKKRKRLGTASRKKSIWTSLDKNTLEIEYLKTRLERLEQKNTKYRKLIDWLSN